MNNNFFLGLNQRRFRYKNSLIFELTYYFINKDADRRIFHEHAEETRAKNNEMIENLRKENKELKKLSEELQANKRVSSSNFT